MRTVWKAVWVAAGCLAAGWFVLPAPTIGQEQESAKARTTTATVVVVGRESNDGAKDEPKDGSQSGPSDEKREKEPSKKAEKSTGVARFSIVVDTDDDDKAAAPGFWLGVSGEPAGAVLLAHLKVDAGIVVHEVMDASPAAKAGLKTHDVIVRCGDKPVGTIEDLLKVVAASEGKEIELAVIRAGDRLTVKATPEKRPEGMEGAVAKAQLKLENALEEHGPLALWIAKAQEGKPEAMRFLNVRPGFVLGRSSNLALPKNTTITINKKDDEPARIEVTHDGKTYHATTDNLNELPEELRGPIGAMLKGHAGVIHLEHGAPGASGLPAVHAAVQKEIELQLKAVEGQLEAKRAEGKKVIEEHLARVIESKPKSAPESAKSIESQLERLLEKVERIEKELSAIKEKRESR